METGVAKRMAEELARLLRVALLGALVAFASFELILRLAGLPTAAGRSIASAYDLDGRSIGPFQAGAYVNSPWPPELAFEAHFNSLGCRGAEPRQVAAPAVLAMGDSMTFGMGVDDADTWPALLDRLLAEKGRARPVVNLSSAQLMMRDHLAYLERALPAIRPSTVVLMVPPFDGPEHMEERVATPHQSALARERARRSPSRRLIDSLAVREARTFLTLWRQRLHLLSRGETYTVPDQNRSRGPDTPGLRERITGQLLEFSARVEAAGAGLVLLPFPQARVEDGRAHFVEPWTEGLVRELGIAYVDLVGAFRAEPDPSSLLLLPYDLHSSPLGNAVVARAAADLLLRLPE